MIFWDLWLNWTHFGSLTEDNPDFFKQIFRSCFGLHLASEAESDRTIGSFMASNSSMPTSGVNIGALALFFNFVR